MPHRLLSAEVLFTLFDTNTFRVIIYIFFWASTEGTTVNDHCKICSHNWNHFEIDEIELFVDITISTFNFRIARIICG